MAGDKERLVEMLRMTRQATEAVLDNAPGDMVVHAESAWRVQDICMHLMVWDQEAAAALRAHARGETYLTAAQQDMEVFNQQAYQAHLNLSYDHVREKMAAAHTAFVVALEDLPEERLSAWLVLPWGPHQSVENLVVVMVAHEDAHRREIELHQ